MAKLDVVIVGAGLAGLRTLWSLRKAGFRAQVLEASDEIGGVWLGLFLEPIGAMLITLPILLPLVDGAGVNLIWFGVFVVKLLEIGMITPPIGMNVFVPSSTVGPGAPTATVFRGILWFFAMDLLLLGVMIAFPQIVLFIPSLS